MKLFGLVLASILLVVPVARAAEISAAGVIRAEQEVIVRSEATGIVSQIMVQEGDKVRQGQLLVELKNNRQKIGVEVAQATLGKSRSSLLASRVSYENAKRQLARLKLAGDALPRKDVQDMQDQVLRLLALMEVQEAETEQAAAELKLRENDLQETEILAPFDGTVTRIYIHKGDALRPLETNILELVALDQLYAEVSLPVKNLLEVHPGQKVRVRVESEVLGRAGVLDGRVTYIDPKLDAASRTFLVKVSFSDPRGLVRPGMVAQVRF